MYWENILTLNWLKRVIESFDKATKTLNPKILKDNNNVKFGCNSYVYAIIADGIKHRVRFEN